MTTLADTYSAPVALGDRLGASWTTVHASFSGGAVQLEQDGQHVFLTGDELRALVELAAAS